MEVEEPTADAGKSTWETAAEEDLYNSHFAHLWPILKDGWNLVFKKLQVHFQTSPEDAENVLNASPFFHRFLAAQRTTYLFEKVFPLVAPTVIKEDALEEFSASDILRCREVCQLWNAVILKSIPKILNYYGEKGPLDNEDIDMRNLYLRILRNNFCSVDQAGQKSVHDFMSHFDQTHDSTNPSKRRNPFIWGNISLDFYSLNQYVGDADEKFATYLQRLQGISLMLSKYGSHVNSFKVGIYSVDFFRNAFMLHEWLLQTPNLKKIRVKFYDENFLGIRVGSYTFPKLRFLERMNITGLPPPLFKQLIRQNNHVSELHVGYPNNYYALQVPLPNLKKLKTIDTPIDIVETLGSPRVTWALETLELENVALVGYRYAALFQVIYDKFADTLVSLSLQICGEDAKGKVESPLWQDCKNYRLDLPSLKNICLDFGASPVCLDFMLPMKSSLEKISASYNYRFPILCEPTSMGIIQFVGFEERMLESNIWAIFKKLNELVVFGHSVRSSTCKLCYLRKDWTLKKMYA